MSQRDQRSTQPELGVAQWLTHHAAWRAPACLSARLEEEWLADLESRSSAASRLCFAVGCCWATLIIVNEHSRSRALAPNPVVTTKGYVRPTARDFGYFSLRSGTLFLIVGLHARSGHHAVARALISDTNELESDQLKSVPRPVVTTFAPLRRAFGRPL
jgi:hypothetical protein